MKLGECILVMLSSDCGGNGTSSQRETSRALSCERAMRLQNLVPDIFFLQG